MNRRRLLVATGCLALTACTSGHGAVRQVQTSPAVPAATVWLCRPGASPDPCRSDLTSTTVLADGTQRREVPPKPIRSDLDCFYVYPTVSQETTANSDLRIQPAQINAAVSQASRFSSVCRVWAPMYRQRTLSDLLDPSHSLPNSPQSRLALSSLRAAWLDYLAHDNHGRPVVLIGHSQGAAVLIRLIRADIDPHPALRQKIAMAILLGGNVTVATGSRVGGSFQHLPLCSRRGQGGCVVAYSSFPGEPPADSLFGRPGAGVSIMSGEPASVNRQVACVNPAALSGGPGLLHPYAPTSYVMYGGITTPWTSFPGRYVGQCRHAGTATWLQVTPTGGKDDVRPLLQHDVAPAWGYHDIDVNVALGDLVGDVAALPRR